MRWTKKGLVYAPDGRLPWAKKHAFPPTPHFPDDRRLRLYVAFCDEHTVGRVGYVDVDAVGTVGTGHSLRPTHDGRQSAIYRHGRPVPGAGHWGEHRHL